jgi:hypothetical protein
MSGKKLYFGDTQTCFDENMDLMGVHEIGIHAEDRRRRVFAEILGTQNSA